MAPRLFFLSWAKPWTQCIFKDPFWAHLGLKFFCILRAQSCKVHAKCFMRFFNSSQLSKVASNSSQLFKKNIKLVNMTQLSLERSTYILKTPRFLKFKIVLTIDIVMLLTRFCFSFSFEEKKENVLQKMLGMVAVFTEERRNQKY